MIGGAQEGRALSEKTYLLTNEEWFDGPSLIQGQSSHSCARIRSNGSSQSYSIIVVGSTTNLNLSSVEILDEGATFWRPGPGVLLRFYTNHRQVNYSNLFAITWHEYREGWPQKEPSTQTVLRHPRN